MRIGLFHSTFPDPERKPGGVDIWLERLAGHLAARGHAVTMFTFRGADPAVERDYRLVKLGREALATNPAVRLGLVPLLLNERLPRTGYDVLHLHGDDWLYLRRPLPTVRTFYGSALDEARHATTTRRRVSRIGVYAGELLASHLATRSYAIGPGMPAGYHLDGVLSLAVDAPPPAERPRSAHPVVLFVGAWEGRKRGALLHRTFADEIRPAVPDAELWMVSDRCDPAPGVRWIERPSDAELLELYAQAWVFCSTSSYEGFGIPYIEAMSMGTPVVATPNPGSCMVLDGGRAGRLVDVPDLGAALVELLRDGDAREALAARGRERAKAFAWSDAIDAHEAAYADAIAAHGRSR